MVEEREAVIVEESKEGFMTERWDPVMVSWLI